MKQKQLSPDDMKRYSFQIANAYKNISRSSSSKEYEKYKKLVEKSGIPQKQLDEIQSLVIVNPNFRPLDTYKFW
jgi:uncharacterized protein (DUF111 family)